MNNWFIGEIRCINGVAFERTVYGFRDMVTGRVVASINYQDEE